ncbi:MAG: hypothetical protein JW840_02235 [Candidatus Thermoplasmatota archaeon]|nr:hypothetical protein [Candidatus Thermoplasmatota archaeon]
MKKFSSAIVKMVVQKKDFEPVLFDFIVIDDQMFSFHMKDLDVSSHPVSLAQMMLQRIFLSKRFITQVGL